MANNGLNTVFKIFLIGCGGFAALVVLVIGAGVVWLAMQPESGVKLAHEIDKYAVKYIEDHNLLEPGEKVLAYYDATMSMDGSDAAILTDRRLMHHANGNTASMRLAEITDITHRKETLIGDIIEAEDSSGTILKIEIAPLNQGETFRNATMSAWKKARGTGN
jgi:hypothetical protein